MLALDGVRLALLALRQQPLRTALSLVGVAIGVAAVVVLTSIGEGARRFVLDEFSQFGTNILQVTPGKVETLGLPGVTGGTTHKLTLDDAHALERLAGVTVVVPTVLGQARVEAGERGRSVYVLGTTAGARELWKAELAQGAFLPDRDQGSAGVVAVLGAKLARELFPDGDALGRWVRVAGWRLRVVGVAAPRGTLLGWDFDDVAYVPVASAMAMFDRDELHEVDVAFLHSGLASDVTGRIRERLSERHDGREDFTIVTQAAMLESFDAVLSGVTLAVATLAGVSLLVGAVGVLTILWIAVGERTYEIGLQKALGATSRQVLALFLAEATAITTLGGLAGLAGGLGSVAALRFVLPGLPLTTPPEFALAALATSALVGLAAGVLPAAHAAALDPIQALRAE